MNLREFLVKAKVDTYSSGRLTNKINKDGAKEFIFQEDNYLYTDKYFGTNPFFGQELVFEDEKFIWGMNYYGFSESFEVTSKDIYIFLKLALKNVKEDEPYRGPRYFKDGDYQYFNEPKGNLERFVGVERIDYKEKTVYRCEYHGGLIK